MPFKPYRAGTEEKYSYCIKYYKNNEPFKMYVHATNKQDAIKQVEERVGEIEVIKEEV